MARIKVIKANPTSTSGNGSNEPGLPGKLHSYIVKSMHLASKAVSLLTDTAHLKLISILILVLDFMLNIVIVNKVKYTEIDWIAYMQECEGFLNGTYDYSQLKGDTGPLVYPAAFVYIFSILYYITSHGTNVRLAQYIFVLVHTLQLLFALRIYTRTKKVQPYVLLIAIFTSYRIHSIYVLRLFNDTVAVLLFYIALNLFLSSKWTIGSVFYSLAVGVKMNILLYAPALFFSYLSNLGIVGTLVQLSICACVQLLLGLPFLLTDFRAYLRGSFDLGRVFLHKWTVNYRFLPVDIFENTWFHVTLLVLHATLLAAFLYKMRKYFTSYVELKEVEKQFRPQLKARNVELRGETVSKSTLSVKAWFLDLFSDNKAKKSTNKLGNKKSTHQDVGIDFGTSDKLFVLPFFVCNLIGVACARSLHYQFYVWYFHSLPYLVFSTDIKTWGKFLLIALIEMCWNTYPSTNFSSGLLHLCHFVILVFVWKKL